MKPWEKEDLCRVDPIRSPRTDVQTPGCPNCKLEDPKRVCVTARDSEVVGAVDAEVQFSVVLRVSAIAVYECCTMLWIV